MSNLLSLVAIHGAISRTSAHNFLPASLRCNGASLLICGSAITFFRSGSFCLPGFPFLRLTSFGFAALTCFHSLRNLTPPLVSITLLFQIRTFQTNQFKPVQTSSNQFKPPTFQTSATCVCRASGFIPRMRTQLYTRTQYCHGGYMRAKSCLCDCCAYDKGLLS
jgi:hypothetical protein